MNFVKEFLSEQLHNDTVIFICDKSILESVKFIVKNYSVIILKNFEKLNLFINKKKIRRVIIILNNEENSPTIDLKKVNIDDCRIFIFGFKDISPNIYYNENYQLVSGSKKYENLYLVSSIVQVSNKNKNLFVGYSNTHGFGAFTHKALPKNTKILNLFGSKIHLANNSINDFPCEWNALSKTILLIRFSRTIYGFINHSPSPNCLVNHDKLIVTSIINIQKNEELFLNYKKEPLPVEYLSGHGSTYLY